MQETEEIDGLIANDSNLTNYRLTVERFGPENEEHPTIRRLKPNSAISAADLDALEANLFAEDGPGSRERIEESYGTDQPLGQLIREIVGLDPGVHPLN
jgi:type I restriction enzyme, R subunit